MLVIEQYIDPIMQGAAMKLVPMAFISTDHYTVIFNQPRKQVSITIYEKRYAATKPNFFQERKEQVVPPQRRHYIPSDY